MRGAAALIAHRDGRWRAQASYPGLRLWPESLDLLEVAGATRPLSSGSRKSRVDLPGGTATSTRGYALAAVALIERRPGPTRASQLRGTEAFACLWGTLFRWPGLTDDEAVLARVAALAEQALVLKVGFGTGVGVAEILAHVRSLTR